MFKRVEKRRLKRQEEEELGLNEDMKEVLGMHDTDSEESDSDSDDSGHSEDDGEIEEDERVSDDEELEPESSSDGGKNEAEEEPAITVQEALRDPVYVVSLQPVVKACVVCPGKLLKGAQMVTLHRTSNAHERRVRNFAIISKDAGPTDNAWDILHEKTENKPTISANPTGNSKRTEKRKSYAALRKAKREKQKAKTKAKKATPAAEPDATSPKPTKPPKKKQKIDMAESTSAAPVSQPPSAPLVDFKKNTKSTISSIVRSTSERAKKARAQAVVGKDERLPKSTKKKAKK